MRLVFSILFWASAALLFGQLPNSHADIPPHLEENVVCWFPLLDHFEDISGEPIVGIPSPSGLGFEATDDPGIPFQSYTSFSGGVLDLGSPERLMWPILKPGAFSVWFRPQGTGANGRLYSAENNECCGDIEFKASSSTAEAAAIVVNMLGISTIISVPYEGWTHMVISANSYGTDSVQCSMYLNGDLYLEQSPAPANYDLPSYLPNGYDDMFIGQKAAPGWDKWGGDAAHIAWFDRGLTLDEINYLFTGNLSVGCTDPTACNFDPEALQDDGSCIEFDIEVPLSCHVGNELECSALVSIASTFEPESIGGYDFIGSYSGSTYYLSQQPHSTPTGWAEQQNIAASFGGHLVDILSQGENDALVQLLDDFGWPPYIWLGLSDDGDEGNWTWSSGEPLEFTNWYPNEPNNCGGGCGQSNWGQLYTNGQWDDFGIGAHHCIIELPQQPTISWNNGEQGLTASYPDSIASIGATLIVDGVEVCTAFENVVMGQGCNDPAACNYNQSDECNVSCVYVAEGTDCGLAISSLCGEGTVWDNESQTCVVTNPSDSNFDGCVQLNDLLDLLSAYGTCGWQCGDPVSYEGYDYATVQIGEQCWFAENARYLPAVSPPDLGSEDDGQPHAYVTGFSGTDIDEAASTANYVTYGALYNFAAVTQWQLCPSGWSVPSVEHWVNSLDAPNWNGQELRSVTWNGINTSGFDAMPGGFRDAGGFFNESTGADFWTSTEFDSSFAERRYLLSTSEAFEGTNDPRWKSHAFSVRCVKDAE